MGKFYTANEELANYLTKLGLTHHCRVEKESEEEKKYFTDHSTGKQVKINKKDNLVSLLDNKGTIVDYSSSYTDNQIQAFLQK